MSRLGTQLLPRAALEEDSQGSEGASAGPVSGMLMPVCAAEKRGLDAAGGGRRE